MKKLITSIIFTVILIVFAYGQHLKKDGTPDMRYKENKTSFHTTPKTSNYNSGNIHLKKDGTPDRRYKENKPDYNPSVKRDANGKIIRSESAKKEFMKQTGYPNGRPGYVIDHIIPLKKGGCDCPSNMQWQTLEQAKQKDKIE
jgi:hypothetical protein